MSEPAPTTDSNDRPDVLFTTVLVEGSVLLIALGIGWLRGESPWSFVRWEWPAIYWGTLATAPPVLIAWLMLRYPVGPLRSLGELSRAMTGEVFAGCRPWNLAFASAWAGVAEELLFRGVVQQMLTERVGVFAGLLAGGVLFGLAHPLSALYVFFTTLMGFYLGWVWIASDYNLLAPMLVHGLYDFVLLSLLVRKTAAAPESRSEADS